MYCMEKGHLVKLKHMALCTGIMTLYFSMIFVVLIFNEWKITKKINGVENETLRTWTDEYLVDATVPSTENTILTTTSQPQTKDQDPATTGLKTTSMPSTTTTTKTKTTTPYTKGNFNITTLDAGLNLSNATNFTTTVNTTEATNYTSDQLNSTNSLNGSLQIDDEGESAMTTPRVTTTTAGATTTTAETATTTTATVTTSHQAITTQSTTSKAISISTAPQETTTATEATTVTDTTPSTTAKTTTEYIRDCKDTLQGREYRGSVSVTVSGATCQRWDSQVPHFHRLDPSTFPSAGLGGNECRNPDGEPSGPWCYTTDENIRWEYCNIPMC